MTGAEGGDEARWDNPDEAVQVEDDNPEALAGEEVTFDPEAVDDETDDEADDDGGEPQDFSPDPWSSAASAENLPAEGA